MSLYSGNEFTNPVVIYMAVTDDVPDDIINKYSEAAETHNKKIYDGDPYVDSGFDIFQYKEQEIQSNTHKKINLGIRCAAFMHRGVYNCGNITGEDNPVPKGFKLHTRSSIGKRYIRLANNVGIIDRGYRGEIGAIVDNINTVETEKIEKGQRLFQICMPDLEPFIVKFCGRDDSNLNQTQRGSGGFGSTGF